MVGAVSGEMIENYPQAFSHIGLINAASATNQAPDRLNGMDALT